VSKDFIVVVDSGLGNVASVRNMIYHIGFEAVVSGEPEVVRKADRIILPGVGSFDTGVSKLKERKLWDILNLKALEEKVPVLGICLGMQLMTLGSEEGKLNGLGWVEAETVKFRFVENDRLVLPHMGWNTLQPVTKKKLFLDFPYEEFVFYFIHSYHVVCRNMEDIAGMTSYGYEFVSSFEHNNIYGVQFHPEKSHKYGMAVLKNFIEKG